MLTAGGTLTAMAAARIVVGAAAQWQPPIRLGLNKAVIGGATGAAAR